MEAREEGSTESRNKADLNLFQLIKSPAFPLMKTKLELINSETAFNYGMG